MSTPSGVLTFLFTDIEGSTRRWEADPDAMRVALTAHDEVLRSAISDYGGKLFKHTGDGVCAAFPSPRAAVGAAIAAQRALELPVRMGVATGEAETRGDDYFGAVLNRAARVMAAGHGGQILLDGMTAGMIDGVDLIGLGPRRLRDIAKLVDVSPIRQLATVRMVGTSDYKELIDVGGGAFEWLGEGDTRNQTNTPDLAEVAPTFGMASAKPQATEESLDDLFFNVEQWLIDSVFEAIAAGEGAAFVSGNGTKKPTGFLAGPTPVSTADSSRAFGTLQYIASGQAAAMPTTPDTFYDIVYSLRARYRANAKWVTSKLVLATMRKYKEATTNAYMWQPGLSAGQPDMFAGYPVIEAEDMPAVGAGAFPLAFGDFREGYLIADRVGMRITRDEITAPGFVKFYIRKRVGGKLRNTQAIKLLKIAAS